MPRKRDTPPYEIMRNRPPRPAAERPLPSRRLPKPAWADTLKSLRPKGIALPSMENWGLASLREPIELRLPAFGLILAGVGVVLLLGLSFWLGTLQSPPAELPAGVGANPVQPDQLTGPAGAEPRQDPRAPGLNYLRLPPLPLDEADRLQAFFRENGVASYAVIGDNARLAVIYLIQRGLTPEQYRDQDARESYRNGMLLLGVKWKRLNNNRGDDLSSMYYEKYNGPSTKP